MKSVLCLIWMCLFLLCTSIVFSQLSNVIGKVIGQIFAKLNLKLIRKISSLLSFLQKNSIALLFLLITFWLAQQKVFPQNGEVKFEQLSVSQGLADNEVQAICQDSKGFMWFGTVAGLCRFDGYNFINYGHIRFYPGATIYEDKRGLLWLLTGKGGYLLRFDKISEKFIPYANVSQTALNVYEDQKGDIWIPTMNNGLAKYLPEKDSFKIYKNIPGNIQSLPHNTVHAVYEDKNGTFWIGCPNGLYRYEKTTDQFIPWKSEFKASVFSILEDRKGELWMGTSEGLYRIDQSRVSYKTYEFSRDNKGKQIELLYLYEDSKNRLWAGGYGIISQFDRLNHKFIIYDYSEKVPIASRITWALHPIVEDNKGMIWIGINIFLASFNEKEQKFKVYSDNFNQSTAICSMYKDQFGVTWFGSMKDGVYRYDTSKKPFHNVWKPLFSSFLRKNKLDNSVSSLFKDEQDILWVGKQDGLIKLDESKGFIQLYIHQPEDPYSLSHKGISFIAKDSPNTLWIGSFIGGLNKFDKTTGHSTHFMYDPDNPKSLKSNTVESIIIDKEGVLWVLVGGALDKLNPEDGTFTHYSDTTKDGWLNAIYEDKFGTMWVGQAKGLSVFDRASGTFKQLENNPTTPKLLINTLIYSFYEDNNENFWFCAGSGLVKLDRKSGIFTPINGSLPNKIIGILEDDHGTLWLLSNEGISTYNPSTGRVRNYDEADGVDLNASFFFPWLKDNKGFMYFGGFNGLIKFHPDSIKDNPFIPPIVITSFKESNKDFKLDSTISEKKIIELSYFENNISFEFAALNYSLPQKNQYAYKLEGLDNDWVYSGTRRFASYPDLQPGNYIFRVKGSNNDGVWNEAGTSISLIITPPWWKTRLAYGSYGFLFLLSIYGIRRYEMSRLNLKQQVKMDEAVLKEKVEIDQMKSRFFANISHEFRTPLTLILGPAEKIISNTTDEDIKNDANIIKRNSRRVLQLINQLLELSKLESGKLKLEASRGNIVSFVKGVALSFESLSESKDITLKLESDKEFIELYFDKDKMLQIFTNLLSNAFKFTPEEGKIAVSVREIDNKEVEIKIKDSGIGIPPEEIPKLFDRFYQVDSSHTREYEGTGIGLALTKELVELHHGNIGVESKKQEAHMSGTGWTEFTVKLPLGRDHLHEGEIINEVEKSIENHLVVNQESHLIPIIPIKQSDIIRESLPEDGQEEKTIILIVEDNYDMREYIKESLDKNYLIEEAVNGEQGVRKAEKIIPDLIISDMMMPKMDGNELVRILKNDEKTSHIPIILLTAKAGYENKLQGLETGADDYLTKPFDLKELRVRVKNLIHIRKKLQEKYSKFESLHPSIKEQKRSNMDEKFLARVGNVIDEHLSEEKFDVEQFCQEVAMSRTQLHRKLKALTGKPASLYIRSVKLARAKKMIENQQGNISEIAYSVGFSSPVYFTRCFKEEFGYPPSDLKK